MPTIAEIIKKRRYELNLTLEEVGAKVGVGKATVQRWESGNIKTIRQDKIAKLAEVLQISPAVLIDSDVPQLDKYARAMLQQIEGMTDEQKQQMLNVIRALKGE